MKLQKKIPADWRTANLITVFQKENTDMGICGAD